MDPTSSATGSQTTDQINAAFIAAQQAALASGTSGTGTSTTNPDSASAGQSQLDSDTSFFLTMLTTQLQNQDPTSPMDTNTFTQQIATYSGVQQQVTTNSNLEKLIAAQQQSTSSVAVGYIGKEIESAGDTGLVLGGQGAFSYTLPSAAATTNITLTDSDGNVVFTGQGTTNAGRNIVVWDGLNSTTSVQEPDGVYTLAVTATDASGASITPTLHAVTIVSGVETGTNGDTMLMSSSGPDVDFSNVQVVREPTRIETTSGSGTDTTSGGADDTTSGGTT